MDSIRRIVLTLLEYRTIKLDNGDKIYRDAEGTCYLRSGNRTRRITDDVYEKLRSHSKDSIYTIDDLTSLNNKNAIKDIEDFKHHEDRIRSNILKYGDKGTRMDTLMAFMTAIDIMKDVDSSYQDIKGSLGKKTRNLIDKTINHEIGNTL